MTERSFARKRDMLLVICLLALSLGAWALYRWTAAGTPVSARLLLEGQLVQTIDLDVEQEIVLPQRPGVRLQVQDGRCGFVHSDCPDQVCVNTGMLELPGQYAACLPNGMVLQIVGEGSQELDTVVY